jgi:hypothetical protein
MDIQIDGNSFLRNPVAMGTEHGTYLFADNGQVYFTGSLTNNTFAGTAGGQPGYTLGSPGYTTQSVPWYDPGDAIVVTQNNSFYGISATTTTLSSSAPAATLGQNVILTASVTATVQGAGTPAGTITFLDGTTVLGTVTLDASGQASLSIVTLALGSHAISATYSGNLAMGASASAPLTQTISPVNDDFTNRTSLAGQAITITASNVGATRELAEPNHAGNAGGRSVWWTWTASSSGMVVIDTIGSTFDTLLGVYTAAPLSTLTLVSSDDNSGGNLASKVTFAATAGTIYQIAVDGVDAASGDLTLHLNFTPPPTLQSQSINDGSAQRSMLSSLC